MTSWKNWCESSFISNVETHSNQMASDRNFILTIRLVITLQYLREGFTLLGWSLYPYISVVYLNIYVTTVPVTTSLQHDSNWNLLLSESIPSWILKGEETIQGHAKCTFTFVDKCFNHFKITLVSFFNDKRSLILADYKALFCLKYKIDNKWIIKLKIK